MVSDKLLQGDLFQRREMVEWEVCLHEKKTDGSSGVPSLKLFLMERRGNRPPGDFLLSLQKTVKASAMNFEEIFPNSH